MMKFKHTKLTTLNILHLFPFTTIPRATLNKPELVFFDNFFLVAKITPVRIFLTIVAVKKWYILQLDVNKTLLNEEFFQDVCMELLKDYKTSAPNLICKLNYSLYGLRQAFHQWFCRFSTSLIIHGFKPASLPMDPSIKLVVTDGKTFFYPSLYRRFFVQPSIHLASNIVRYEFSEHVYELVQSNVLKLIYVKKSTSIGLYLYQGLATA
ncbi:hypothetical protein CR513_21310, partial [Mucuna pruriens]